VWTLSSGKEALVPLSDCAQHTCVVWMVGWDDLRETLDELELVLDLAALVGDLLLSAMACQYSCVIQFHLRGRLTSPAARHWRRP